MKIHSGATLEVQQQQQYDHMEQLMLSLQVRCVLIFRKLLLSSLIETRPPMVSVWEQLV